MTGRYDGRPERQNEYFIPGDGISREVIQADICRYLGNDALVRPGNHNGRQGFFIRAYRNLTSEMIADLKADSARWEADVSRRADQGYPRGSYTQDMNVTHAPPNTLPATYTGSTIHDGRQPQQPGPSPPTYGAAPAQPYMDPYTQSPYSGNQNAPPQYSNAPSSYPSTHSPYGQGQNPYPPPQVSYSGPSQPVVTAAEMHSSYTYTPTGYNYEGNRNTAPRYPGPGPGYEAEADYSSPVTSGIPYPTTSAPDPRIGMEPRYTPEYDRTSRPQAAREREPHRRR
ncbi:hypothetical protein N7510_002978 [Penicillium lagena]|uniref:uncharacterized protein n=1 Tax=Penicillium lagena TaxID=94218 RepID=UPI002541EB34|nr:uncharacterized protein N7510_002978 [Penicillium lagena]KAJ5618994.1 hypothetical protein N7510_002978 [Penicillium lagena]